MAREEESTGSLDMLLDTLCNTFGGIILIALLLALSVNEKSQELYDKIVKTDDNRSDLIEQRNQLRNSLLDLEDEHAEDITDVEDEMDDARKEIADLKDDVDALKENGAAAEDLATRSTTRLKKLVTDELTIEENRLTSEEQITRLETILSFQQLSQELKKKPYRKVSLPQAKGTQKEQLPVVIAHGRLYPMLTLNLGRIFKNEDGLDWGTLPDGRLEVGVDPARGIDPNDAVQLEAFLNSVRDAARTVKKAFYLNLFVHSESDSFALFNKIRDEAALRDVSYNWMPVSELPLRLKLSESLVNIIQN
ncbi:MAG: hypothetical protein O3A82_14800 [Verrucomicrobia bacterium]|nr:hypothetical protein [Verrucomicrobiota bacterium]MDA1048184.1 hypothetical protein [Verrucomicrobiota bacterium]